MYENITDVGKTPKALRYISGSKYAVIGLTADYVIGLTADTLSYVMTTENRAFIEKTSASDPDKTFSINWIAYTLQLMLGAEHYGLQVGEIFHGDKRATEGGIHTRLQIARVQCFNPQSPHGWDSRFSERWKWRRVHVVLQVLFARAAR